MRFLNGKTLILINKETKQSIVELEIENCEIDELGNFIINDEFIIHREEINKLRYENKPIIFLWDLLEDK